MILLQDKHFDKLDRVSRDDPELVKRFMGQLHAPVPDLEEGFTNFQDLLAKEGGDITVLGLPEAKEIEWNVYLAKWQLRNMEDHEPK